jgi:26S proteasome regulatory subunit N10
MSILMQDSALQARAVVVLIDNTHSSIDGDFYPTRLEAQKQTVKRFAQYLFSVQPSSEVAIGTLCSSEAGIRSSFTNSQCRISNSLLSVTPRCGILTLSIGIQCAILALRRCNRTISHRRILAFVGSDHDINCAEIAQNLADQLLVEKVYIDIVVIGPDVPSVRYLKQLIPPKVAAKCHFLHVPSSDTVLSDNVLASPIRPGEESARVPVNDAGIPAADLATALALSASCQAPQYRSKSLEMILHEESVPPGKRKGRPCIRHPQDRGQKEKGKDPDDMDKDAQDE